MKLIRVGVDLAKNVFQVHGVDRNEKPVWRGRLTRDDWLRVLVETVESGCEIGMEACGGAHYWARKLQERGFSVKLIAPQFVKPYVQSNKNDANDAEAICEAMSRPKMRFVAVKTVEQQDIQGVHRIRSGLIDKGSKAIIVARTPDQPHSVLPAAIVLVDAREVAAKRPGRSRRSDRFLFRPAPKRTKLLGALSVYRPVASPRRTQRFPSNC